MHQPAALVQIAERYARVRALLNERARRLFVASEAVAQGYGGIALVSRATGVARRTIGAGIAELEQIEAGGPPPWGAQRVRRPGAGRKKTTAKDPTLLSDLQALVESTTRGDPESPLLWTGAQPTPPRNGTDAAGPSDEYEDGGPVAQGTWVSVGVDADTAAFAVESIRRWWHRLGRASYPDAKRLVITADCGGSNGARVRLWKRELQRFADETGLAVTVAHLPPGTSKWNRIEHRLFAYISQNWRGKPLVSHQVIVQLIGATTTQTGLTVRCEIDANRYPKGIKVTAAEMAALAIERDPFHGEWNYTISPHAPGTMSRSAYFAASPNLERSQSHPASRARIDYWRMQS